LNAQLATLRLENADLKAQLAALRIENADLTAQFAAFRAQRDAENAQHREEDKTRRNRGLAVELQRYDMFKANFLVQLVERIYSKMGKLLMHLTHTPTQASAKRGE
jgi:septal ring factor EnvC (AmiA/AmiB activator)